ncbi:uncharacterized protein K460DRAFT_377383 [Cucurbitaria berberidis CBS 394.84]|uniref:C2H2-type domain-containing protein n=1 Tax=Cucurbitaria berberidis CBS 394.84 TaxID=1168544 RepID=A0A9P4GI97_9PLEO|nr:uncharacterized protein K460DRAFT_377383 [Cucurbitaria berberidis CBS 394.84]KAF1846090.1 hypothetical protein K460DRAFT_377383 [Cucurbitaria berberidis CBS 394.84]
MEQHCNAPSHSTMFSCDVCKRTFGSKQAVAQHRKSQPHAKMLARAKSEAGGSNTEDEDSDDNYDEDAWADHSRAGWDDDQDWGLCDKDCGWCGHCADGVDY